MTTAAAALLLLFNALSPNEEDETFERISDVRLRAGLPARSPTPSGQRAGEWGPRPASALAVRFACGGELGHFLD
jgi:hypothetical protein